MSSDRARVLLGPRDTAGCLDAATQLFGRYLAVILPLWLISAIPAGLIVYLALSIYSLDLRTVLLVLYFATVPLGFLLIQGMAPLVLENCWDLKRTLQSVTFRSLTPLLQATVSRLLIGMGPFLVLFSEESTWVIIGSVLCLIPGAWLVIRSSLIFEKAALSRLGQHLHSRNTRELISAHFGTLFSRAVWMTGYCILILVVLMGAIECLLRVCFETSLAGPVVSELSFSDGFTDILWDFLTRDPKMLTCLTMTALLVYTIGRIAWFISYIDLRVRYDCWDMELEMFEQARRLKETG